MIDTTLMAESEEELQSLLKKVKKDSENVGLKLSIQKTKIMASCPISWLLPLGHGVLLASAPDLGCGVLKNRNITLPTKFWLIKAMVFPVVMHRCESWTIKKAER